MVLLTNFLTFTHYILSSLLFVLFQRDGFSKIYIDGKLWMIYVNNGLSDGGLPIYEAITPTRGAHTFFVRS